MKLTSKEIQRLKTKYGSWAIVTGASSGIGLELVEKLAEAGLNLVINARNSDRLEELKKKLESEYHIDIKIVAADVSETEGIDKIIQSAMGLNVGLLVVSAGYGTSGLFIDSSLHSEVNMLRVNCEALLSLTHYYSQQFVRQKRGGIILMSSMVASREFLIQLTMQLPRRMFSHWQKHLPLNLNLMELMYWQQHQGR